MASFGSKLAHAWNAFSGQEDERFAKNWQDIGPSYGFRPDRTRLTLGNERSIISSVYTRLSIDVAAIDIRHIRKDDADRYLEDVDSGLNYCLTMEANLDQAATAFRRDIAMTLFDKGVAAVVPVDTSINPNMSGGYDVKTLRVAEVIEWRPRHVRVSLYNEAFGRREEITLDKKFVAIIENPLFAVMNEPNSTLQRLIRKLNLLDAVDEASSSGKLDLIIQLPYVIKSEARKQQAEQRRKDVEFQLKGSQYGIAYTDGTEKITQLNRPAENNLWKQIQDLTEMLYSQLGLTPEVMNGTADEKTMLNYNNRTVKPILNAIAEELSRKFLTRTARSQHQAIEFFSNPFELVPINDIAEIADKFTRNEILSSNEVRSIIGIKPAADPKADELRNSNMPEAAAGPDIPVAESEDPDVVQGAFDEVNATLDEIFTDLGEDPNA